MQPGSNFPWQQIRFRYKAPPPLKHLDSSHSWHTRSLLPKGTVVPRSSPEGRPKGGRRARKQGPPRSPEHSHNLFTSKTLRADVGFQVAKGGTHRPAALPVFPVSFRPLSALCSECTAAAGVRLHLFPFLKWLFSLCTKNTPISLFKWWTLWPFGETQKNKSN